jgi:tRNA threonylcarbamoyladenosine biosynthesis protein TsaB
MAFALGIPVIGVPTLDALAAQFPYSERIIYPILDAQKGRVYTAQFDTSQGYPRRLSEYEVMEISALITQVVATGRPSIISGEVMDLSEQLQAVDPAVLQIAAPLNRMPRGASSGLLGLRQLISGEGQDPQTLLPFYIRRSEAEVLWEQRHSGGDTDGSAVSPRDHC